MSLMLGGCLVDTNKQTDNFQYTVKVDSGGDTLYTDFKFRWKKTTTSNVVKYFNLFSASVRKYSNSSLLRHSERLYQNCYLVVYHFDFNKDEFIFFL